MLDLPCSVFVFIVFRKCLFLPFFCYKMTCFSPIDNSLVVSSFLNNKCSLPRQSQKFVTFSDVFNYFNNQYNRTNLGNKKHPSAPCYNVTWSLDECVSSNNRWHLLSCLTHLDIRMIKHLISNVLCVKIIIYKNCSCHPNTFTGDCLCKKVHMCMVWGDQVAVYLLKYAWQLF